MVKKGQNMTPREHLGLENAQKRAKKPKKGALKSKIDTFLNIRHNWEDGHFMDDVREATMRGAHPASNMLFWVLLLFVFIVIVWMSFAKIDEATRGDGAVIPSGQIQTVQNLEGGIIKEILVKQGDIVEAGQELLQIDNTGVFATLGEKEQRRLFLLGAIARLTAIVEEKSQPEFPAELLESAPDVAAQALRLFNSQISEVKSAVSVLNNQIRGRSAEMREIGKSLEKSREGYRLAQQELDLTRPLEARGSISKVELLRVERETNNLRGEMLEAEQGLSAARSALAEARSRLREIKSQRQNEARLELGEFQTELNQIGETVKADKDRVARTSVTAPVRAQVKDILVNTIGGVVQPGMPLVELVPLDDSLLVEARIKPQDVAFLRPDLKAIVKITAYDFAIYGGLPGKLDSISPDSFTDEQTGETYYKIKVRTDKTTLGTTANPLPIIPGMVASVDILTGKKTVLQYLLKPINKARSNALKER